MAFAAESVSGVEQGYLGAAATELGRVQVGGDVALDHTDGDLPGELVEGGFQHGRLTGARRTHQVQRLDAVYFERLPVVAGAKVIFGEDRFQHVDALAAGVVAAVVAVLVGVRWSPCSWACAVPSSCR
ncbi:hypothetical protein I552_4634 [Mycobacterium xenopi 3993]|nr:hypothetical protein I552_4634 [Mycobacterium xenopi 3993]